MPDCLALEIEKAISHPCCVPEGPGLVRVAGINQSLHCSLGKAVVTLLGAGALGRKEGGGEKAVDNIVVDYFNPDCEPAPLQIRHLIPDEKTEAYTGLSCQIVETGFELQSPAGPSCIVYSLNSGSQLA